LGFVFASNDGSAAVESDHQAQSKRDYLPSLDISINQAKQQSTTLHIGTHILSETRESNTQTHYQLTSHLIHLASQGARYLAP
jgi:hypothetical protein